MTVSSQAETAAAARQRLADSATAAQRLATQLQFAGGVVAKQLIATEKLLKKLETRLSSLSHQTSPDMLHFASAAQEEANHMQLTAQSLGEQMQATARLLEQNMLRCAVLTEAAMQLQS